MIRTILDNLEQDIADLEAAEHIMTEEEENRVASLRLRMFNIVYRIKHSRTIRDIALGMVGH